LGAGFSFLLARWTLKPIEEAMEKESRFVADASHELRTPLAVLQTENEVTLRDKNLTQKKLQEQVKSNLGEIQKLRHLTDYLLEMSTNSSIELTQTDLSDVISAAEERVQSSAKSKYIIIARHIQPGIITTNQEALSQIVAILLDNAIKYAPAKSRVVITADNTKISVTDQGEGIAEEDLPHIFERFYRAEKSRTSEGFGLGLSLAHNLAEKLHVKLSAENVVQDGKIVGAQFVITL
jgi:signal transduction histidine kinase